MIRNEKIEFIAIVAIAVLMLLAAVPAGVAATTTLFEDDFESGNLSKWFLWPPGSVNVTNNATNAPPWGGYYARFSGNDSDNRNIEIVAKGSPPNAQIDTTCLNNITLSFALKTSISNSSVFFRAQYDNDSIGYQNLTAYGGTSDWTPYSLLLPADANNNPALRIRFILDGASGFGEYAFLDNVTVTGEPMEPALDVNKTVWDPVNETWVKELDAKINDTLQFTSTITNTGNINLTQIRFWDIMDCSLEYENDSLKINSSKVILDYDPAYCFKPKVLHNTSWALHDPVGAEFMELCPEVSTHRELLDWEDTNNDGNVSACDQALLSSVEAKWYHVDRVPYTLNLSNATYGTKYFDSVFNWDEVDLSNPIGTEWLEVCCCKDRYTLLDWQDLGNPVASLSPGDNVTMRNERTQEVVVYTVEVVAKDLVVSREYEIGDYLHDFTQLEPEETITIDYNTTVVRCGVDNNTFVAKGLWCGENWVYSNEDVVTITVPCPSGDAADGTPVIKDVFTAGEPVYAVGRDFAPNKNVSIYITPVRTWAFGDNISDYKIVGPVNTTTDANGSIGIEPKVLMWPNPVPGEYHMVFDDPDGIYEPGVDLYDFFEVRGVAAPVVTPLGIVALVGLLSIVATSTLLKKGKRE